MMTTRPLWAEISTTRLRHNFQHLRSLAGRAELLAIVKANGYGHGTTLCAEVLSHANAAWLGVTSVEEGIAVRAVAPKTPILIMGGIWEEGAVLALEHRLTPVVWEPFHFDWLNNAARQLNRGSVEVHLEIDSGMSRQGVQPERLPALLAALQNAPVIHISGIMTHFHSPEYLNGEATSAQMRVFAQCVEQVCEAGHRPEWLHAGNSASVIDSIGMPELEELATQHGAKAMIRPGLSLYGYSPDFEGPGDRSGNVAAAAHPLQPVLSWKTRIISLREIEAGETVGYCEGFRAARHSRIALLPAGYADGLRRSLSPGGEVLVRGQRAPFAGRISMDLSSIDVTTIPDAKAGDEVVLIGRQGEEAITAAGHARLAKTIPYEILCGIAARVPRVRID
ncbi:alanine racemase [Silvibacterium acidisoli]|uniref:alanine racemase n=1 Tax=Acidobacteriaceae bacterium ZG23-2 TaxID=2883246 RepID=UPI00406C7EB4